MARSSFVVALACATLLLAACGATAGAPSGSETTAVASVGPTLPAVSPSADQATPGASAATLPGLAVQATVKGTTYPAALVATDDAVWALGHTDATWSRIDPATNAITDTVSIGGSYATGGVLVDGKLWALDFTDKQVVGVDPATRKVVAKVPVGIDGGWLVAGDGVVVGYREQFDRADPDRPEDARGEASRCGCRVRSDTGRPRRFSLAGQRFGPPVSDRSKHGQDHSPASMAPAARTRCSGRRIGSSYRTTRAGSRSSIRWR